MSLCTTQYDRQLSARRRGQEMAVASCSAQPRWPGLAGLRELLFHIEAPSFVHCSQFDAFLIAMRC